MSRRQPVRSAWKSAMRFRIGMGDLLRATGSPPSLSIARGLGGHHPSVLTAIWYAYYALHMIRSILGTPTRQFIEGGKSKFSGMDERVARRRLAQLDAATSLESFGRLN